MRVITVPYITRNRKNFLMEKKKKNGLSNPKYLKQAEWESRNES